MDVLSDVKLHFIVQTHRLARMKFLGNSKTFKRWTRAESPFFHAHFPLICVN